MRLSPTLSLYIGRHFLAAVAGLLVLLVGLIFLGDSIELMRRAGSRPDATVALVLKMALFRLPNLTEKVLPFAVLFGAMFAFWRLTRSQELIVARAAGVSVWQFLAPPILVAVSLGILYITALNPLSSVLLKRFEQLENAFLRGRSSIMDISPEGLWLRQGTPNGQAVIHAAAVAAPDDRIALSQVTVFVFVDQDDFVERIDARAGRLENGQWRLFDAWRFENTRPARFVAEMTLATDLTLKKIQDSFASPETMSFWDLPPFIRLLEQAGFSAVRHRLYFHSLLATPLLLAAMVVIAAAFCLRHNRRGRMSVVIGGAVLTGFALYFFSDIAAALGVAGSLPEVLAAWVPASISTLLGITALLHLEDG